MQVGKYRSLYFLHVYLTEVLGKRGVASIYVT